jgi:small subunit ribosomal protein S9
MTNPLIFSKTVGRRKRAIANLKLIPGSGKIKVNGYSVKKFFEGQLIRLQVTERPFYMFTHQIFDVYVKVRGGGLKRQADAFQVALVRALVSIRPRTKYLFRERSFLICDSRKKERRKYGLKKARKAQQFSKRLFKIFI